MSEPRSAPSGTPRFQEETQLHLQRRLRLMAASVTSITGVLLVAFVIDLAVGGAGPLSLLREFTVIFPNAVVFWMALSTGVVWLLLSRRNWSPGWLAALDAVVLWTLILPCLLLFQRLHFYSFAGFAAVVPFLTLFVLARAVLVPSTATRTALLSAPAALGVLAIQWAKGASFARPGEAYSPAHFTDQLVQNQVILVGAIAVAALASRINLGLRRASYDARRLGQYDLHERIGAGGMGEVYRATHALLKRETAVKLIRADVSGDEALRRFEREVRETSRLTHPNTVAIYDYGNTAGGVFYYAMELLDGADLRRIVHHTGPLPSSRVIHVLEQACGALAEAHAKGLVHRDVKPANIMLCQRGGVHDVAKLLDFGLVREYSAGAGEVLAGTPETMPPEVLEPNRIGPRSDLYSLGCVAYYLLSGAPVFPGEDTRVLIQLHRTAEPEPLSSRAPDVPADLATIVHRCLAKDPDARPRDAAEMRGALLACAAAGGWSADDAGAWWQHHGASIPSAASAAATTVDPSAMSTVVAPMRTGH